MPEEETRFQAYLNGDLDLIEAPFGRVASIKASNIGAQLLVNPMLDIRYHGINMDQRPLGGNPPGGISAEEAARARKVRQAMNFAVDRDYLCQVILEGRAVPAKGVIPPGMEAFNTALEGYRFDPERAKRLLAEAGYPGGEGLPVLPYHFNSQPPNPMVAQALQEMLRRVGVRTELRQMDWGAYQNFIDEGKAKFFRLAWIADYPDPENFLYVLFHSKNAGPEGNNARYRNAENDRRLDDARSSVDPVRRLALWREAETRIVDDAPWVFLYHNATALIVKPYVKGLVLTGMDAGPEMQQADLTRVRIETGGR
jgi:peptide/nickel transport system substrate-binding protein/oligopeptide transport system substrate-binding protein